MAQLCISVMLEYQMTDIQLHYQHHPYSPGKSGEF